MHAKGETSRLPWYLPVLPVMIFWAVCWATFIPTLPHNLRGYSVMLTALTGLTAATWKHPILRRVMLAWCYAMSCLSVMAVCSAIGWYRNPRDVPHLPDIVHELVPHWESFSLPLSGALLAFVGLRYPDALSAGTSSAPTLLPTHAASPDAAALAAANPHGAATHSLVRGYAPNGDVIVDGVAMAEAIMYFLTILTVGWCFTQRWRWLALRRWTLIYGTLALVRSFTVLVTTVPDSRPLCAVYTPGTTPLAQLNMWDVVVRASGVASFIETMTCGDMVYSGHTMLLGILGMAWHTYYRVLPGVWHVNIVKTLVWGLIAVSLFLIVAARLHYTLDVILALYMTITLWGSYHRAADDVLVGHRYISVYVVDGLLLYPAIQYMEAPHLGEARSAGMVSRGPSRAVTRLAASRQVQWIAAVCAHYFQTQHKQQQQMAAAAAAGSKTGAGHLSKPALDPLRIPSSSSAGAAGASGETASHNLASPSASSVTASSSGAAECSAAVNHAVTPLAAALASVPPLPPHLAAAAPRYFGPSGLPAAQHSTAGFGHSAHKGSGSDGHGNDHAYGHGNGYDHDDLHHLHVVPRATYGAEDGAHDHPTAHHHLHPEHLLHWMAAGGFGTSGGNTDGEGGTGLMPFPSLYSNGNGIDGGVQGSLLQSLGPGFLASASSASGSSSPSSSTAASAHAGSVSRLTSSSEGGQQEGSASGAGNGGGKTVSAAERSLIAEVIRALQAYTPSMPIIGGLGGLGSLSARGSASGAASSSSSSENNGNGNGSGAPTGSSAVPHSPRSAVASAGGVEASSLSSGASATASSGTVSAAPARRTRVGSEAAPAAAVATAGRAAAAAAAGAGSTQQLNSGKGESERGSSIKDNSSSTSSSSSQHRSENGSGGGGRSSSVNMAVVDAIARALAAGDFQGGAVAAAAEAARPQGMPATSSSPAPASARTRQRAGSAAAGPGGSAARLPTAGGATAMPAEGRPQGSPVLSGSALLDDADADGASSLSPPLPPLSSDAESPSSLAASSSSSAAAVAAAAGVGFAGDRRGSNDSGNGSGHRSGRMARLSGRGRRMVEEAMEALSPSRSGLGVRSVADFFRELAGGWGWGNGNGNASNSSSNGGDAGSGAVSPSLGLPAGVAEADRLGSVTPPAISSEAQ